MNEFDLHPTLARGDDSSHLDQSRDQHLVRGTSILRALEDWAEARLGDGVAGNEIPAVIPRLVTGTPEVAQMLGVLHDKMSRGQITWHC